MKDQSAGDFGDYVKLAMLRRLAADRELAVAWYKTADDAGCNDGRHVEYLADGADVRWRDFDPELYDFLSNMVGSGSRSISALQPILERPGISFFTQEIRSRSARAPWFAQLSQFAKGGGLLFLDPDNGIASRGFAGGIASVTCDEIAFLARPHRTMIVYHHHTRAKGGHLAELEDVASRLMPKGSSRAVCALRASGWSPRSFFIIAPDRTLWNRAQQFARDWDPHVTFHALQIHPTILA